MFVPYLIKISISSVTLVSKLHQKRHGGGDKKMMPLSEKDGYNARLIRGGIGLSLLSVLGFALNRILCALKGRKDTAMTYKMICAPDGGAGTARAPMMTDGDKYREQLMRAAQKSAEQSERVCAYIEQNTFIEESVGEESAEYPLDVVV